MPHSPAPSRSLDLYPSDIRAISEGATTPRRPQLPSPRPAGARFRNNYADQARASKPFVTVPCQFALALIPDVSPVILSRLRGRVEAAIQSFDFHARSTDTIPCFCSAEVCQTTDPSKRRLESCFPADRFVMVGKRLRTIVRILATRIAAITKRYPCTFVAQHRPRYY